MKIEAIARIHTDFKEKFGVPRQSGRAPSLTGEIEFFGEYGSREALKGIEDFSHLWLIFDFSLSHRESFTPTVRPPRLGGNKRVGVFASRSPFRPNSIGLSCVRLERVEHRSSGSVLIVSGADLVDGTPIYDIKPYIPYTDCHTEARGGFAEENRDHKLSVDFLPGTIEVIPEEKRIGLTECLSDDPRPSYQSDEEREYGMLFSDYNVRFTVKGDALTVFDIEKK